MAHSAEIIIPFYTVWLNCAQWPIAWKDKVKYIREFESKFVTALDYKSGDQLGTFGETTEKENLTTLSL
jgi:hypothetical protein